MNPFRKNLMKVEYNIEPINQDDAMYVINLIKIHFRENYSAKYKLQLIQGSQNSVTIVINSFFPDKIKTRYAQMKAQKELAGILSFL